MGRALRLPVAGDTIAFFRTGEAHRPFAVSNRDPGRPAEGNCVAPEVLPGNEDPTDTVFRNVVAGEPAEYARERTCTKCGPIDARTEVPRCPNCGTRITRRDRVISRRDPVEYGPKVRVERRLVDPLTGRVLAKYVTHDRLSRVRREHPDEIDKKRMERMGIASNPTPDRFFRLASK